MKYRTAACAVAIAMLSLVAASADLPAHAASRTSAASPPPHHTPGRTASPPGRTTSPAASSPAASLPSVPGLSIGLTDGRSQARAGDRLAYTVRIGDAGTVTVPRLRVTLTLLPYLRLLSAGQGGHVQAGSVIWHARLRAGGSLRFTVTARVGPTPARLARLAVVACATLGHHRSAVCAAHLDRLPATPARSPTAADGRNGAAGSPLPYVAGGLVVLTVIATAATIVRLRTRRRPRGVRRLNA